MPQAEDIVRAFLTALETRNLEQAAHHLAPGCVMTFPGGVRMTRLDDLVAWSKPRYTRIRKAFEGFETLQAADNQVVYCRGTLSGTGTDGRSFDGIRFIDRFEVSGGLITRQDVWNDMGEVRAHV
ncbi:nuclear transport factor 2 family protein [Tropicimonas sp. S265A]|uniref:nuclear transport factor 2 family protein n=1 Tax=Tropicimonas sp. S265A TaxID=3415134 RepID=UPI003C7CB059